MSRDDPQLNIRLRREHRDILDAAAFVHRKGAAGKLVQELVEEAIERYRGLPSVQKALEAMHEQDAQSTGKLTHLADQRDRKRGGPGTGASG
jgi:uncharacterized protein (DUF1778 family)